MSGKQLRSLSDRLNYALELTGVTKAELARMIGVKPQSIQYLCSTQAASSKFTFEIAHALNINFEWLAVGTGEIQVNNQSKSSTLKHSLSKYTFDDLRTLAKQKHDFINEIKYPFQVMLEDHSMWPRFPQNTYLTFDTKKLVKSGDFILVYLHNINDFVFRELSEQGLLKILVPFNSNLFKEVQMQEKDIIVGSLIEAYWRLEE